MRWLRENADAALAPRARQLDADRRDGPETHKPTAWPLVFHGTAIVGRLTAPERGRILLAYPHRGGREWGEGVTQ
jgi:hypothetical protein